jgi:DNA-binding transcriptional regulator YiaG
MMSRTKLGATISEGIEKLASYESGRVPLSLGVFQKLWAEYRLNPQYLAEDIGPQTFLEPAFSWLSPNGDPRTRFSKYYAEHLRAAFHSPEGRAESALEWVKECHESMMIGLSAGLLTKEQLRPIIAALDRLEGEIASGLYGFAKRKLDLSIKDETTATVQKASHLAFLIKRVRAATKERGAQTLLSETLGVDRRHLNAWLAGRVAPSAEYTLRLLDWVTRAEAKQRDPGRVGARPGRKTQVTKHLHAKKDSGPPPK